MRNFVWLLMFLPLTLFGIDSIYVWDNDQGYRREIYPSVAARDTTAYIAWEDLRWGSGRNSVYRQRLLWNGTLRGYNVEVDTDNVWGVNNGSIQLATPLAATRPVIQVWERIVSTGTRKVYIYARIGDATIVEVDSMYSGYPKTPAMDCRDNGEFVVSFTYYYPPQNVYAIYHKRYNIGGNFIHGSYIEPNLRMRGRSVSRCAFCDSGYVVVYVDSATTGDSLRSIYLQYRGISSNIIDTKIKVSRPGTDGRNELAPDVAVNQNGFVVVTWTYEYSATDPDVYARTFQMRPGLDTLMPVSPSDFAIANSTAPEFGPKVTVFPNNDYMIVYTKETNYNKGVYAKVSISGTLKPECIINNDQKPQAWDQYAGDVACRWNDTCIVAWMNLPDTNISKSYLAREVFCRTYYRAPSSTYGILEKSSEVIDPTPRGPGWLWYYDDENYDDPLTVDWNEDPIDEEDSVYLPIDSAIVDQFDEFNQVRVKYHLTVRDTLPRSQKSGRGLSSYKQVIVNLGFRLNDTPAGVISTEDQYELINYINSGKPILLTGNDFGFMYNGTTLFEKFHANYVSDGQPFDIGNIDTLYGQPGTFAQNETLAYQYRKEADNYVDIISPRPEAKLILADWETEKEWLAGRCVGWGNYWKDLRDNGSTIYCSFSPNGIKDRHHPHTAQEFIRRCLGFLGMVCPPEPITAIYCSTNTATEGSVILRWRVVSDDSLKESAAGPYKLKFSRKKITSEVAFNDSCEEYYQKWNTKDSVVGSWYRVVLEGLPPMDTLIFALKVSDEDTLWGALGAEPRAIVSGDSVTPHYLKVGSTSNPYGYVKDFSVKYEFLDRRAKNDTGTDYDSLFVTWDYPMNPPWFYVGFARCNLYTEGDLFIYVDTKPGGADSTVPYNGTSGRSAFQPVPPDSFKPDYCLIVDNGSTVVYKKYVSTKDGRGSWIDTTFYGRVCEDSVINNYLYTELYIPYNNMGYTAGNPFKLVVLMTQENTNYIINAFPIFNPLGTYKTIGQYYSWGSDGLTSGKVPARKSTIGIGETTFNPKKQIKNLKLAVHPNPFTDKIEIFLPTMEIPGCQASLEIYDVSGRIVKSFNLKSCRASLPTSVSWDGTDDKGEIVSQGIYFCKFTALEKSEVVKIIYLK